MTPEEKRKFMAEALRKGQQGFDAPTPTLSDTLDAVNRGTIGGTLGSPVDIANELLRPLGMASPKPFLGSEWLGDRMQDAGMVTDKRDPLLETAAGFVDPLSGLAKVAALGGKGLPLLGAHTVFHGSPHSFDAFDASKIGTGEGAQAYGHGIYFAESPEVAKSYENSAGLYRNKHTGEVIDSRSVPMDKMAEFARNYEPAGNVYTADIPDEWLPRMLDWDKPLSEQGPDVQTALRSGFGDRYYGGDSAEHVYKSQLQGWLGDELGLDKTDIGASNYLSSLGIPGIRYLDGSSRTNGQGTYNYVIFPGNEDKVKILERNGRKLLAEGSSDVAASVNTVNLQGVPGFGQDKNVEYLTNPNQKELERYLQTKRMEYQAKGWNAESPLRYIIDSNTGDAYFFDASDLMHQDMADALGISKLDQGFVKNPNQIGYMYKDPTFASRYKGWAASLSRK